MTGTGDRDPTAAPQGRIVLAAGDCRNALQIVLGLRQLASELDDLPTPVGAACARDLRAQILGLERRLFHAVEQLEAGWLTLPEPAGRRNVAAAGRREAPSRLSPDRPGNGACPPDWRTTWIY